MMDMMLVMLLVSTLVHYLVKMLDQLVIKLVLKLVLVLVTMLDNDNDNYIKWQENRLHILNLNNNKNHPIYNYEIYPSQHNCTMKMIEDCQNSNWNIPID